MEIFVKTSLFTGVVFAIGAGIFRFYVAPDLNWAGSGSRAAGTGQRLQGNPLSRRLTLLFLAGLLLLLLATPASILVTSQRLLGVVDLGFASNYLTGTRHGQASIIRVALLLPLALTMFAPLASGLRRTLFTLTGILVLLTFTGISHSAAMGGQGPLLADATHFLASTTWIGTLYFVTLLPLWGRESNDHHPLLPKLLERLSTIGLVTVVTLFLTGIYLALTHIETPAILTGTEYGQSLIFKLLVIAVVLIIAAVNRFVFVPRARNREGLPGFRRILAVEGLVLLLVLGATGLPTSSALPHDPNLTHPTPLQNLQNFLPLIGGAL